MMPIILIPYIYLNKTFKLTQVLNKMLVCKLGLSLTILEKLQEYVYIYIYILMLQKNANLMILFIKGIYIFQLYCFKR